MKRTTSVLGLALAAALLLPACTGGTGTGVSAGTELPSVDADGNQIINVAYELPLSGGAGGWDGALMSAGIQIGLDRIRDDLAAIGVAVNPIINDHESSSDTASVNVVKDIEMYRCPVIFGTYTGPLATMAPVCAENQVLLINSRAPGDNLVGLSDWLYNTYPSYAACSAAMADCLYNDEGYRSLGIISDAGSTSKSQLDSFLAAWTAVGGTVAADVEVAADATDYLSVCAQIVQSGAEVVLMANGDDSLTRRVITQFIQLGAGEMGYICLASGDTGYGAEFQVPCYTSQVRVYSDQEIIDTYCSDYAYQDYEWEAASTYVGTMVNGALLLKQAIGYCHANGLDYTGANLKQALDTIGTFEIMGGTITFLEGHTVESPIDIYRGVGSDIQVIRSYYEE